ncbi:hypothetical protein CAEBREN_16119 [Caenorhabditis brenneri]|uniref:F-box domain-containing protein n=1 Tax=Caenorhabditis brenneri TaxID=135651 RepID=G0MVS7_CAEBE|nr:hypothetical protein CAEBREN_16119 [Caenorhabditis brenneri]
MRKTVRKFSDYLKDNTSTNVSPWDSYKELCNEFGDDFMNFPEFEYRFYRFHGGEKDDFDSSSETPKKTFSDLPVEIIGMFVKKLRPIDRILLRLVSANLQSIVDTYSPKLKSRHVRFTMYSDFCQIYFRTGTIELKKLETGYQIEDFRNTQTVILSNFDYREGVLNAFLTILGHPKTRMRMFKVEIDLSIEDCFWLTENLSKSLGDSKIWARKFVFDGKKAAPLLPFLSFVKPGALRTLPIYGSLEMQQGLYAELAGTEQWRQARKVDIPWLNGPFDPDQLQYFAHFNCFDVRLSSLTLAELMEFVKTLGNSENFQKCILRGQFQITADEYAAAGNKSVLREPIEGTSDRELELRFCKGWEGSLVIQRKKKRTQKN